MRRFYLTLAVGTLSLCAAAVFAQAPKPPVLDDLDKAWVQNVVLAQQLANKDCQGLESVKAFLALQADIVKKIEDRHAGYTVDLGKGVLVAKVAP